MNKRKQTELVRSILIPNIFTPIAIRLPYEKKLLTQPLDFSSDKILPLRVKKNLN